MDNLILEAIVAEARPRLVGHPVWRLAEPFPDAIVVLFDDPDRSRLLVSASPVLPRLHLTRERSPRREPAPSGFAALASHHLAGAILAAIEKDPAERVVRLRFAGASGPGKSLVAELLGRSSNVVLLDAQDRVLGALRRVKSEFRRPESGAVYDPPRRGERIAPRALTAETVAALVERGQRESHPLLDLLLVACPSLGPLAAGEIEHRARQGEDAHAVLEEWLDRAEDAGPGTSGSLEALEPREEPAGEGLRSDGTQPSGAAEAIDPASAASARGFVYAPGPLEEIDRRRSPGPGRLLLAPLPLSSADPDLVRLDYASLSEAADAYYGAVAEGITFRTRREALAAIAKREGRRAHEIALKVAHDLQEMEKAGRYRLYGEALLAGLTRAERKQDTVSVPDPYDPDQKPILVPIDPGVTLQANADRYFQRHRKAERGRAVAEKRRAAQANRSEVLSAIAAQLEEAAGDEDLDRAQAAMRSEGIAVGIERSRTARKARGAPVAASEPRESGVRIFTSSDGYEILVGKGGNENDRLTFKVASPEDFWLHAEGAAGAHVVVRNPRSEPHLPPATLREAAALAGFYSKAKEKGKAEVLVTRRKYVRRIRGAPRGTVTVKKHTSMMVVPKNPFEDTSRS